MIFFGDLFAMMAVARSVVASESLNQDQILIEASLKG